jgi:hypothetical protein
MSKFKVGDKVRVNDGGEGFSTYEDFFKENDLQQFASRYRKGVSIPVGDYKVVGKGKHGSIHCYGTIYVLEDDAKNIYLMTNDKGSIELIKQEPTTIYASDLMTEARKNPEKYEGKRYKVIKGFLLDSEGVEHLEALITKHGNVIIPGQPWLAYVSPNTQLREIKPEPKPVTFMEAVKAYENGKSIKVKDGSRETTYNLSGDMAMFKGTNDTILTVSEILNGTWYIEETP